MYAQESVSVKLIVTVNELKMLPSPPDATVLLVVLSVAGAAQTPVPKVPIPVTPTLEQVAVIAEAGMVVQVPPVKVDVAEETLMVQLLVPPKNNEKVTVADDDPDTAPRSGLVELKLIELGDTAKLLMVVAAGFREAATVLAAGFPCPQPRTAAIVSAIKNWTRGDI